MSEITDACRIEDDRAARTCPALFLTAPASNQGKTTVVAALARLHARMGRRVRVFKCGPDFLDPQILAAASGAAVYNVDLWMCGEEDAAARLYGAAGDADLILVEGVMGLYDGNPSSADVARRFHLPVVSVIDGSKMAQTFGAVAMGLATYQPELRFAGVLANRVASERHAATLRESLPMDLNWLGHLPRDSDSALPERHLGLVQAAEVGDLSERIDRVADALSKTALAVLPPSIEFVSAPMPALSPLLKGRTIAIARDAAFAFLYPANLDCLVGMGARLAYFSPLADRTLPSCDAVWFPGGYPELHGTRLAENRGLWESVAAHHAAGYPILAECGGMMAMFETLTDATRTTHRLAGLIPGGTIIQSRLAGLGLQAVELPEGKLRGHTFHYSRSDTPLTPLAVAGASSGRQGEAVYRVGRLTASYFHFYFPSNPEAVARMFLPIR